MAISTARAADRLRELEERRLRVDLAAAFRLAVRFDWHEAVANHFSVAVAGDGHRFLMNPRWMHFSRIRASDLLLLDADDAQTMARPNAPDPSAWCIHGRLHARLPQARCILHTHMPYATALTSLADPGIKPIDQNTARFFRRCAIDSAYGGIADNEAEGERLAALLGEHSVLLMGNHGVLVAAPSVAEAFDELYYLERAARNLVLAYSTGRPLSVLSDEVAEQTARQWEDCGAVMKFAHFEEMKRILDRECPDYRD
jgi:ribulose-5-phosphate 4-epimerase/fuculose-1-phosphate aldolase